MFARHIRDLLDHLNLLLLTDETIGTIYVSVCSSASAANG